MKISFVIPSHNCVTFLPHAVTSALEQSHNDIEVIVIDDASTDRTREYLAWLQKDKRVKVLVNAQNLGRSKSRNKGNLAAQGEIICVLDADDLATPNRAEIMARKFKDAAPDYVYGSATVIDLLGHPINTIGADVFDKDQALKTLLNRIVHSSAAYTKEFAQLYPYRDGDIAKLGIDDWAQQIEARLAGARFDYVPQRLCAYRILQSAISKTRDEKAVIAAKEAFLKTILVPA